MPSNIPTTNIPDPFAGNWSSNSVGLISYWDQGSYTGSYGNSVSTISISSNGTGYDYGYYEGAYGSTAFYRYACGVAYKEESDGSVTITMYPHSGEMQYNGGARKAIGSGDLYPNSYFVLSHCMVYSENGKTYLQYHFSNEDGGSDTPSRMERL